MYVIWSTLSFILRMLETHRWYVAIVGLLLNFTVEIVNPPAWLLFLDTIYNIQSIAKPMTFTWTLLVLAPAVPDDTSWLLMAAVHFKPCDSKVW